MALEVRQQERNLLAAVVAEAEPLERLWRRTTTQPGENPLTALAARRVDGRPIIQFRPDEAESRKGFLRQLAAARAAGWGTWLIQGSAAAFRGTRQHCPELSKWGPNTRAVIAPVLAYLHQAEDQLCERLGRAPRSGRPALPTRAVTSPQIVGQPAQAVIAGLSRPCRSGGLGARPLGTRAHFGRRCNCRTDPICGV